MIGWLLVLSFVLGFALTWIYMVRSVSRTVDPVAAPRGQVRAAVQPERMPVGRPPLGEPQAGPPTRGSHADAPRGRVVEFEED